MKCCSFLFAAMFLLAVSINAFAQEATSQSNPELKRRGKFAQMDKNGDGMISRDEWTRKPKAFDKLDLNHDGFLTRDELLQARQKFGGKRKI